MEMKTYRDWNVDGCIGEGAFGKVYKISRQDFGHIYDAALKVIEVPQSQSEVDAVRNDGMSEQNVTQYFQSVVEDIVEEFALMSKLKGNSNIVSYEDHSVEKRRDGFGWNIYIRMELLTPLFSYIKQHKMTVRDVIQIGIDICQALEVCQKYNIIHRDIKPENIFVSDIGTYKLGDFGIARQLEKTSSGLSKKGTFTYMAPEVYKGLEYNSTVDIYSLGIVLYRFLNNNRSPFMPPAPQPIRYSDKEKANIMRISGQRMPKPCNASGRLAEIVLKACAYNPSERYESAGIMRQALEEILYSDSERKLIYPAGDTLENKKADYILDETNRGIQNQVKDKPKEAEDRTFCLFNGGSQGNVSQTGSTFMAGMTGDILQTDSLPVKESTSPTMAAGMEEIKPDSSTESQKINVTNNKENSAPVISGTGAASDIPSGNVTHKKIQQQKTFKPALKFIIPVTAVIVATAVIIIVAIAGKEPSAKVPNLEGMSVEKAEETLKADGMVLKVVEEKYSDTADSGQIMSQSLEEGEETEQGAVIEVSVSKGKETVEEPAEEIQTIVVPDFENLSKDEAKQKAREYKLSVSITEEFSNTIEQGTVIKQDVTKGTEAELGSSIGLVVSKGQELATVPKIKGVKLEKAKKLLKSNKLKYKVKREYSRRFSSGTVMRQDITKGKKVERGTVVIITVSKGAKPVPTKAPQTSTYTDNSSSSGSSSSGSSYSSSSNSSSSGSSSYKPPAATKKPAAPKPKPAPKPKKDNSATWSLIN